MELTPHQARLIEEVRRRLKRESWFRGVCLDHLPSDDEIACDFEGCVEGLIVETEMWDNFP